MKGLVLAALCMVAGLASAETITLGPDECGIVKQCVDIPNDQGATVSLYGAPQYPWFFVYLDGVQYKANVPSGYAGTAVPLIDTTGDVIYLTYEFSTYVTCVRSGRGQHCSTHWNLVSGAIVR